MIGPLWTPEEAHVSIPPHHDNIFDQHREISVDILILRNIGNRIALQGFASGFTEYLHRAGRQWYKTHDGFEQSGLSRPVDSNQRAYSGVGNRKTGIAKRGVPVAIGDGDVVGRNTRRAARWHRTDQTLASRLVIHPLTPSPLSAQ